MTLDEYIAQSLRLRSDINYEHANVDRARERLRALLTQRELLDAAHPSVTFEVVPETSEEFAYTRWAAETILGTCRGTIMLRQGKGASNTVLDQEWWWIGVDERNPVLIDFQNDDEGSEMELRVHLVRVLQRMKLVV